MRPYIICHMTVSENERVTGPFLETSMGIKACDYYYQIHRALKADAFACGRVTMETSFTHGWFPDLKPFENIVVDRRDFIVKDDHAFCAVAFDTKGRLGWKDPVICDEDPGYDKAHIVEVLSEDTKDAYLAYLQSIGISYLFAGKTSIDIRTAVKKLARYNIAHTLLLEGGSLLNQAFLQAGVIDRLSLVHVPMVESEEEKPLFYDRPKNRGEKIVMGESQGIFWKCTDL